jgi:ASC-1-like (ASCH) protein
MPDTHRIEISQPYHGQIKRSLKCCEGRKGTTRWGKIKVGDTLLVDDEHGDVFNVEVTRIVKYKSIREYLVAETLERTLPGVVSLDEGEAVYLQWSTLDQVKEHGFLGISIKVIP